MQPISQEALRDILVSAGAPMARTFKEKFDISKKEDGSLVTSVDVECNRFLKEALGKLFPEAAWLSEESADNPGRLSHSWVWIVDPLDGTKEFVRGIPEFAISVALVRDHKVVTGGIYNPISKEGGVASEHGKALFWGIERSERTVAGTLNHAVASISRSEFEDGSILPYLDLFAESKIIGSVAYKLLRVAAGVEDLTLSVQPKSEWDICAGVCLLNAVGKRYMRLDRTPVQFNQGDPRISSGGAAGSELLLSNLDRSLKERHL